MKVKEFIKISIEDIVNSFNNVSCAYKYDLICDTHYIKISPSDFFKSSEELAIKQADIVEAFYNYFEDQSIIFLTEGSLIDIGSPEYILDGDQYQCVLPNLEWNFEDVNQLLTDFIPQIKGSFFVEQEIHQIRQHSTSCDFILKEAVESSEKTLIIEDTQSLQDISPEYDDYSLLAA